MPISFSTCTISTVCCFPSTTRICFINATNARASAFMFSVLNGERISCAVPSAVRARGNLFASVFTQCGT